VTQYCGCKPKSILGHNKVATTILALHVRKLPGSARTLLEVAACMFLQQDVVKAYLASRHSYRYGLRFLESLRELADIEEP